MNKRVSWGFLAVSGAFFLFIVGLTGYRIEDVRRLDTAMVRGRFPDLANRVTRAHQGDGAWDSPQLKSDLRAIFDGEPRLLLLAIHSPTDGILYLVSRNRWYLRDPAEITPEWRGTPSYQTSRGYEDLLSQELPGEAGSPTLDAIYVIMGREDLYPIVRDDLYLFLAFLLVCGVFALIVTSSQQAEYEQAGPRARPTHSPLDPDPRNTPPRNQNPGNLHSQGPNPASAAGRAPASGAATETPPVHPAGASGPGHAPDSMMTRLQAELQRTEAADEDLSLARVRVDPKVGDQEAAYRELGIALREQFMLVDLLFEDSDRSYSIILPDVDLDDALRTLDDLRKKIGAQTGGLPRSISAGASARSGRLIDAKELREEADISLAKAIQEGGDQVIGFRADAARFRGLLRESAL
ncbi:MAG TPA: hypothetical protein VFH83_14000 [Spirochaetia bacterium]|nr:hypothetical protein [Spirochaetia bacterium]